MEDLKKLEKGKKDNELEGMGTTIVCILMVDDIAHIAHVGDSRLYIFRYNNPYFVTKALMNSGVK